MYFRLSLTICINRLADLDRVKNIRNDKIFSSYVENLDCCCFAYLFNNDATFLIELFLHVTLYIQKKSTEHFCND